MEPYSHRQSREDLQTSRSRASSHVSVGESSFRGLNIADPIIDINISSQFTVSLNQAPGILPLSSARFSPSPQQSPAFIAISAPQLYAPLPLSSQGTNVQDWAFVESASSSETPLLRLEQPQDQVDRLTGYNPEPETYSQSNMSAMGVQYYPRFDASLNRSSLTWPVFDPTETFPDQESALLDPFNEQILIPSYARSISSSSPQGMFSPEQRELKWQLDQARQDSKSRFRRERSASNSYNPSVSTTPDIIQRSVGNYSQPMTAASNTATVNPPMLPFPNSVQIPTTQSPNLYHPQYPMVNFPSGYTLYSSGPGESCAPLFSSRPLPMTSMSSAPDLQFSHRNPPTTAPQESPDTVRVIQSRPKPQCWDHGCNGRQFSTFSNLLRHQREKSGVASKPTCPKCGAEFTRTTARNGHMVHEKCKSRRNS